MSARVVDIVGKRFGRWRVIAMHPERRRGMVCWLCRCDCGLERVVGGHDLRNGTSMSCGGARCTRRGAQREVPDLRGKRFGYWLVLAKHPERYRCDTTTKVRWLCRCTKCGITERPVMGSDLRSGKSTNCGCGRLETLRKLFTKHGLSGTPSYWRWQAMLDRCRNPRNPAYPNYGGREDPAPVAVMPVWHDFQNYHADTGGDPPSPELTLDRTNNDAGYGPTNWRWADRKVQRMNQRPRKQKRRRADITEIRRYADSLTRAASPAGGAKDRGGKS